MRAIVLGEGKSSRRREESLDPVGDPLPTLPSDVQRALSGPTMLLAAREHLDKRADPSVQFWFRPVVEAFKVERRPGRKGRGDDFYAGWADRYIRIGGRTPIADLATESGIPLKTVRHFINEARRRALLTQTEPGKPGGGSQLREGRHSMASINKVANGYRARWRAPDGGSRSRTFGRKLDAERFLAETSAELVRGVYVDTAERRTTLTEYAERWMASQEWRDSTRERTRSVLDNHVLPAFGIRPIGTLRRSEIQAWVTSLGQTLAPTTTEGTFRLLASILRSAVHDRLIPASPCDGVRLPRREGVMLTPLSVAEVETLADAICPDLRGAVLSAALTGLRQGELFGLTEDHVRWLRREVVVDRQLVTPPTSAPVLGPCKTARSVRVVPLADRAVEILSEQVATLGIVDGFVFHRNWKPWRRNHAANAMRAAGLGVGWHALRHHCASVLIAQGLSVTAVAAVLGHSPAECLATYAAWWPSEDESIRIALSRAWSAAGVSQVCHEATES